jgi:hypothetical protein
MDKAYKDENVWPYLTTSKYKSRLEAPQDDWHSIVMVDEGLDVLVIASMTRNGNLGIDFCIYSFNKKAAARGILCMKEIIARYRPYYISSVVHESNIAALKMNKRVMGNPYGCEVEGAWNGLKGLYEKKFLFKRIINGYELTSLLHSKQDSNLLTILIDL